MAPPIQNIAPAATPSVNITPVQQPVKTNNIEPTKHSPPAPTVTGSPVEKPAVFIPNLSNSTTSIKIPSFKDMGKQAEDELAKDDDPYLKGNDKEAFTMDQFLKCWSDYAAKMKKDGKAGGLISIFTGEAPVMIKPYDFEVAVSNRTQEAWFREEKPDVMNYLRSTLKNFDISVNTRVDEQIQSKRPYTAIEKFQYMANKNPQLIELRRRFGLEPE